MKILTLNECSLVTGGFRRRAAARPQRRLTRRVKGRVTNGVHGGAHADMMTTSPGDYGGGGYTDGGYSPTGYGGSYSYAYNYSYAGSGGGSSSGSGGGGGSSGSNNDNNAVDAEYIGNYTVIYWEPDGSAYAAYGYHPNRDHNPLDIEAGSWAYANGAIGSDDGGGNDMAIFSTDQDGFDAAIADMDRIDSQDYGGNATLFDIIETWSPENQNNTEQMEQYILTQSNLDGLDQWGSLTPAQQAAFLNAYATEEGYTEQPFQP